MLDAIKTVQIIQTAYNFKNGSFGSMNTKDIKSNTENKNLCGS